MGWSRSAGFGALTLLVLAACTPKDMELGVMVARLALVPLVLLDLPDPSCAESAPDKPPPGPLDRVAADGVLAAATERIGTCGRVAPNGPRGPGVVCLAVEPSGSIVDVRAPHRFARTPVADCIVDEVMASAVRPFEGTRTWLCKPFVVR